MIKPPIVVTSYDPHPSRGSEPGKSFAWTRALSNFFQVHMICNSQAAAICRDSGKCNDWVFHPLDIPLPFADGLKFLRFHHQWCQWLIPKCREVFAEVKPVGLHHPSLGWFRQLPRYELLGIPYTLGPLGGGEFSPFHLLRDAGMPPKEFCKEAIRPTINYACLLNPYVRSTLHGARQVVATTLETEQCLRWAGTERVVTVFADVIDLANSPPNPLAIRARQLDELRKNFRCIWSARALWWKGGQLAIRFIDRLRQAGISATLDTHSAGECLEDLKRLVAKLGLEKEINFNGMVPRDQLLQSHLRSHLYVYPTMHDSGSSAIPEAYSTGLPSFTLALGGMRDCTSKEAGYNETPDSIEEWLNAGVRMVRDWQARPETWLAACEAAYKKAQTLSPESMIGLVRQHLCPAYEK